MTDPRITSWSEAMDAQLKAAWGNTLLRDISKTMGLSHHKLRRRANALGLPKKALLKHYEPPREAWTGAATVWAILSGLRPRDVLAGARDIRAARCRQRAFRDVLIQYPDCSIAGLARVAGWDRTNIHHALRRAQGATVDQVRESRATGRMPKRRGMNAVPVSDAEWDHDPRPKRDWLLITEAAE